MNEQQSAEMMTMMREMMNTVKRMEDRNAALEAEIAELKSPKKKKSKPVYKTVKKTAPIKNTDDFILFMQHLKPKYKLLVYVGIVTSLRISDLVGLTYGQVRYGEFKVIEKKTGKSKLLDLFDSDFGKEITDLLDTTGINKDSDYLFTSNKRDENGNPKPITRQMAWHAIKTAAVKAGLRFVDEEGRIIQGKGLRIGTHSLRKTFSFWYLESGGDIVTLSEILNHADVKTTKLYLGLDSAMIKSMASGALNNLHKKISND